MSNYRTYSKKEITKILSKASEFQTQKELYGDKDGLTKEELLEVALEVGIDSDSVRKALELSDHHDSDTSYNWISASPDYYKVTLAEGEISEEKWEEIIQEIRSITGEIGKISKVGKSFEWEQKVNDFGYRHITLTPYNGQTKIQYVSSWKGVRFIVTFFTTLIGFMLTAVSLDGSSLNEFLSILAALGGASVGFGISRFFLKPIHTKKVARNERLIARLSKKISTLASQISMDAEQQTEASNNRPDRLKK